METFQDLVEMLNNPIVMGVAWMIALAMLTYVKQRVRERELAPDTRASVRKLLHFIRIVLEFGTANDGQHDTVDGHLDDIDSALDSGGEGDQQGG